MSINPDRESNFEFDPKEQFFQAFAHGYVLGLAASKRLTRSMPKGFWMDDEAWMRRRWHDYVVWLHS